MNFLIQKTFAQVFQTDGGGSGSSTGGFVIKPPTLPDGTILPTNVCDIINSVTNFIIAVSIPIAGLMILYAAFKILTAAENPKRFEDGKNIMIYTVIGLVVILLAKGLVVIISQLLGVDNSGLCS